MDISDISTDILEKKFDRHKVDKNLWKFWENIDKNSENDIINNNRHFKVVL